MSRRVQIAEGLPAQKVPMVEMAIIEAPSEDCNGGIAWFTVIDSQRVALEKEGGNVADPEIGLVGSEASSVCCDIEIVDTLSRQGHRLCYEYKLFNHVVYPLLLLEMLCSKL